MPISYVGGQTAGRAGATSTSNVTFNFTGGSNTTPSAGDLVVVTIVVGTAGRTPSLSISAQGYTVLTQQNANGTTYDTSMVVAYKRMGATPDTTVTMPSTGNNADAQRWTIQCFRGVDATTPMDATAVPATGTGTGRPNPGAITPVTAGAWVTIHGGGSAGTGANYIAPANFTTNFLTGFTADTNDAMVGSGYWSGWSSGAVDPAAYTGGTTNAADSWAAYTLALRPEAARTGNLAATESGADTASASGDVMVQGSVSASEAATEDVFVASGALSSGIAGDLSATESGADTAAASGDVFVSGTMSPTEAGADTASMSGDVFVAGALAGSETGQDTASVSGGVIVAGAAAASEVGEDVAALDGIVPVQGDVSAAEDGEDVFQALSLSEIQGDLSVSESGDDQFAASGIDEPQQTIKAHAPKRKKYIYKGKKLALTEAELMALLMADMMEGKPPQKPKAVGKQAQKALNAVFESIKIQRHVDQEIEPYNDDEEAIELLLSL